MTKRIHDRMPQARTDKLAVEDLFDETLVYDLRRHRAHCLNRAAVAIWRQCDGRTTVAEAAEVLHAELGVPANEDLIWTGLLRLKRAHLLADQVDAPARGTASSRREALRALGLLGGLCQVNSPRGTMPGCTLDDPATFGIAFRLTSSATPCGCTTDTA